MATDDYHLVMKSVRVADLKGHLSEHLRNVRRGHPLTVMDRDTPIAEIVPYRPNSASLPVRQPSFGAGRPMDFRLPEPLRLRRDAVTLLLAARKDR